MDKVSTMFLMPISLDVSCPGEEKGMKAERATEKKLKIKRERYTVQV